MDREFRPTVSVVVPAYNAALTVEDAILSALRQTISDIEVVVCNDASTDKTAEILSSISDPRVVVLNNSINQGEGAARDKAIMAARGEWVAVLDADDVWDAQRLERLLEATNGETDVMVFDDLLICHHTSTGLVPWRSMRGRKAFKGDGTRAVDVPPELWASSSQFLMKPIIHNNIIRNSGVRHSVLKFGADTEFFLKLIAQGARLRYVPGAYYLYRITPNAASANKKRTELMNSMLASIIPLLKEHPKLRKAIQVRIQYRRFVQCLKEKHVLEAFKICFFNPQILPEFFYRAVRQTLYLAHRRLHSGSAR